MATYGELRALLVKAAPGVDLDLLDGWINDRYADILDKLPWRRVRQQAVIQTVAVYETGTVAVTNGVNTVTGAGTTFTSAMTGRMFRIAAENAYYEFTFVSTTSGTLDRTYEGTTATGASYKIAQSVFQLPTTCRYVEETRLLDPPRDLLKKTQAEMSTIAPHRGLYGNPQFFSHFMDDASDPPRGQIEFYPIPDKIKSIPLWFISEPATLTATATNMLVWMRPGALKAGVMADILRHQKDHLGAQGYEAQFELLVADMVRTHSFEQAGVPLRMATRLTRHRRRRGLY